VAVTKETELYLPVKRMLEEEGFTVRSEVQHCDLVAYREDTDQPIIVELKRTFNIALIFQLIERQRLSPDVYAAVEYQPGKRLSGGASWNDAIRLCRKLGAGLLGVQFYKRKSPVVHILCEPEHGAVSGRRSLIGAKRLQQEFERRSGDFNTGGSTGKKLVTAYREKALRIAALLEGADWMSPREISEQLREPKIALMLQKNYYNWFERIERGRYRLTGEGRAALAQYANVVDTMSATQKESLSVSREAEADV
jgi:hypothetical protein